MAKKNTAYVLILIFAITFIMSGCGAANVIDSKVRTAVGGSSRSDEAVEWLLANKEMIIPELANRMSNYSSGRSRQAAEALIAMGEVGRSGVIELFDTISIEGRNLWCTVLAEQRTKQAVMELMILSSREGSFDIAVAALVSMGEVSLHYLAGQLHNPYYSRTVDTALANFGEAAVEVIIPAVHSTDAKKVNRALVILSTIGEKAAPALAADALQNANSAEEATQIADIMLRNYPAASISAIMGAISPETDTTLATRLLYEIAGSENIALVLTQSGLGDAEKTSQILREYVKLCGIEPVLNLALGGDDAAAAGAEQALAGGEYDKEVLKALLRSLTPADAAGSRADVLAGKLISDTNMQIFAHCIIGNDAETFAQLTGAIQTGTIGDILSSASENAEIFTRMQAMVQALSGESRQKVYTVLASCSDTVLPTIALSAYAVGGEDGDLAAQALTGAVTANGKFLFSDVDMAPYAQKIIDGLSGGNSTQKSYAQIILSRVSTSKSNNGFYTTVFSHYKDRTIFSILAGHYGGGGALPLNLSVESGGQQIVPKTVSLKKTGDVKNVSSSNEPDFNALITGFAPYLGWSQMESGAELSLEFDCDITPKSKRYSGLIVPSYLGAEAQGTLTAYVNGEKVKSSTGYAVIFPPDEYPGPDGEYRYKSDPENAPASEVYVICFINAMYNMWGEKALFGLYNYDVNSTNQAAQNLFSN